MGSLPSYGEYLAMRLESVTQRADMIMSQNGIEIIA